LRASLSGDSHFLETLANVAELDPPPTSITAAARILGVSERTARRKVKEALRLSSGGACHLLLEGLRLLNMCEPEKVGKKEFSIAHHIGRSRRAAQLLAIRRTGLTLSQLRADPAIVLQLALRSFNLRLHAGADAVGRSARS